MHRTFGMCLREQRLAASVRARSRIWERPRYLVIDGQRWVVRLVEAGAAAASYRLGRWWMQLGDWPRRWLRSCRLEPHVTHWSRHTGVVPEPITIRRLLQQTWIRPPTNERI